MGTMGASRWARPAQRCTAWVSFKAFEAGYNLEPYLTVVHEAVAEVAAVGGPRRLHVLQRVRKGLMEENNALLQNMEHRWCNSSKPRLRHVPQLSPVGCPGLS